MTINGYKLKSELQNANSGFSKWAFATKNGREYFIKELINPVYPVDRSAMSPTDFEARRNFCREYEETNARYFDRLNRSSRGNLVRIVEFFRSGSRYYLINEKVTGENLTMDQISMLPEYQKLLLLKTAAGCFRDLHAGGIVHFDVKPNNIIIKRTKKGNYTAKLIDFDSGFIKGEYLERDELGGDLTYLAPETFLAMYGEDIQPDEKSDIFALGLVFHEYYCGTLPYFDANEYEYPYESILDKGTLGLNKSRMPEGLFLLIASMLNADPKQRPSAQQIVSEISKLMGASGELSDIRQLGIHFCEPCARSITISRESIKYRNTAESSTTDTGNTLFPKEYYDQCENRLFPMQFDTIVGRISDAGLAGILKPYDENKNVQPSEAFQTLIVMCGSGSVYEYYTLGDPCAQFKHISEILSQYCDFPILGPLGIERRGSLLTGVTPQPYKPPVIPTGGFPVDPPVNPPTGPSGFAGPSGTSGSTPGWFKKAGDL